MTANFEEALGSKSSFLCLQKAVLLGTEDQSRETPITRQRGRLSGVKAMVHPNRCLKDLAVPVRKEKPFGSDCPFLSYFLPSRDFSSEFS